MPGVVRRSPAAAGGALGGYGDITLAQWVADVLEDGAVHLGRHLVAVAHEPTAILQNSARVRCARRKGGAAGTVDDTQEPEGLSGLATSGSVMSVRRWRAVDAVSAAMGRTSIPPTGRRR